MRRVCVGVCGKGAVGEAGVAGLFGSEEGQGGDGFDRDDVIACGEEAVDCDLYGVVCADICGDSRGTEEGEARKEQDGRGTEDPIGIVEVSSDEEGGYCHASPEAIKGDPLPVIWSRTASGSIIGLQMGE